LVFQASLLRFDDEIEKVIVWHRAAESTGEVCLASLGIDIIGGDLSVDSLNFLTEWRTGLLDGYPLD
jgi:hypothetical protein